MVKQLPTEVWVQILKEGEWSYFDLKRFQRVNKLFRSITKVGLVSLQTGP
jgi:hypothetical protein